MWYLIFYYCRKCNKCWTDEWDAFCDDECPICRELYTPYVYQELDKVNKEPMNKIKLIVS